MPATSAPDQPSLDFDSDRIRRIRIELEETVEQFAERIGSDPNTISAYESGKRRPKAARIIKALLKAEAAAGAAA